jgi:hypothetical protein
MGADATVGKFKLPPPATTEPPPLLAAVDAVVVAKIDPGCAVLP